MENPNLEKIRLIKSRHEHQWMTVKEVQAVGIGVLKKGENGIIISVDKCNESLISKIPAEIDGVHIEIVERGGFKAL